MHQKLKHKVAIFFVIFFMTIISAPTVIASIDNSVDISSFYGICEEEESESFKLLIETNFIIAETTLVNIIVTNNIGYTYRTYPKPHLNLISPPPEFIL